LGYASVARRANLAFIKEGIDRRHLDRSYQTLDQRFLRDEQFVDELKKTRGKESR